MHGAEAVTAKKPLEGSEEKAVIRLAITYGVLRRLGFSESKVEECLRAIRGIDLEEAYGWVWINVGYVTIQLTSVSIIAIHALR